MGGNLLLTVPVNFDLLTSTPLDFVFSAQYGLSVARPRELRLAAMYSRRHIRFDGCVCESHLLYEARELS